MLSAFSHQIQSLVDQINEQKQELSDLKQKFKKEIESSTSNLNHESCSCSVKMDKLRSKVNDNFVKISDLTSKFDQLSFGGFEVCGSNSQPGSDGNETTSSPFVDDNDIDSSPCFSPAWKAPGSREPTPSQIPEGYESPPIGLDPGGYSAKEFFAAASYANPADYSGNVGVLHTKQPPVESGGKKNPWSFENPKIKEPPQGQKSAVSSPRALMNGDDNVNSSQSDSKVEAASKQQAQQQQQQQQQQQPIPPLMAKQIQPVFGGNQPQFNPMDHHSGVQPLMRKDMVMSPAFGGNQPQFSMENIKSIAAENCHLKQQIVTYRQKVNELESLLRASEATVTDLRMIREHFVQKEREWTEKQDWYEHKLKLLKQDKRRRGETIGKLLKCLDDAKDTGRLDEGRVREGRAVLAASLGSRGMHPEDRVCKVVDALDLDRVPRAPQDYMSMVGQDISPDNSHTYMTEFPPPQVGVPAHLVPSLSNANRNNSTFWSPMSHFYSNNNNMAGFQGIRGGDNNNNGMVPIYKPGDNNSNGMVPMYKPGENNNNGMVPMYNPGENNNNGMVPMYKPGDNNNNGMVPMYKPEVLAQKHGFRPIQASTSNGDVEMM